jgi:hypothetical protein
MKYLRFLAAFGAFLLSTSSWPQQQAHRWQGTIEERDGIRIIRNPQEPVYGADAISLVEELAIRYEEGKEERIFTSINDIAVDKDGNIYLLDIRQGQIRAFDKNGGYLRSIGRKGQGPGEFQFPVQILVSPQQELVVCDLMQRRVLFFSLDGTFKRSVPTWRQGTLTRLLVDSEGDIIAELVLRGEKRGTALMKFDSSFNELFTVAFKERKKLPLLEDISPRIVWSVSVNDEIIWGDSDEYEINVLSQEGMILKKILKSFKPEKIVEANYREAIKSKFGEKPIPLDFEQRLPEYYPAFRFIGTDNEGRIFVSTYEKANDGHGYTVDVFSRESEYIARISLKTQPRICKERKLYTVEEDEKGYPVLKRYGTKWKIGAHGS